MQLRSIISSFALVVLLTLAVGGAVYFHSIREALRNEIVSEADDDAQQFAKRAVMSLSEHQKISAAVAGLKELPTALITKNPRDIQQANVILDHFQSAIQIDVCYLIDHAGDTIASSNRNAPQSFLGKNFAFRPYFQDALSGKPAIYPALGTISKKRGLFYSYPVYGADRKQPLGVLVIKSSTDPIEKEIYMRHKGVMLLADPHGIVFISSRPEWLYHSLWKIPEEELSAITASQQFGEGPIEWIGMVKRDARDVIDSKGKKYIRYQKEIANLPGWSANYMLDSKILSEEISVGFFRKFGPFLVAFCIVIGLTGFLLYRKADQEMRGRKLADDDQKQSLSLLKATLESTADGILVVNSDGKIVSFNARFAELWRLPDDILSSGDDSRALKFALDQLNDPQAFIAKVEALYAHPEENSFDVLEFKDNRIFERYSIPQRMQDKIVGRVWSFRDVTERKRAKEELRRSEEFLRNTLDNVDEGFLVVDRDFRILLANKTYSRWVGMQIGDIIGRKCHEITHHVFTPCYETGVECAVRIAFDTGMPYRSVHNHTDKDGNNMYIETKTFPVRDASGNMTSVIEVLSNITEKYLLEEERLKTQKLESLGVLAGGIAHDFNNLLQGIFGYISMAKVTIDRREKSLAMLEEAEKALHLSVNLTTQLLTFSKGGKPLKKLISIGPAVENAVKFALSGSQTSYRIAIPADLRSVEADAGQLAQVVQNIVLNADEAMTASGTVRIVLENIDLAKDTIVGLPDGGLFVRIAIQDSGNGIPEQNLAKIFDPYFTTKQKGSGLGLATSYSIIKNHGGVIEVKSEINKGTTFFIYLPASGSSGKETAPTASSAVGTKKGRILLMDDDELVRSVAREMVASLGHDVVIAEDGKKAIDLFREARETGKPFDMIILDLTVKFGMGGEEAIRKIRDIDPKVKAVVSSGYADSPVVANYRAYGFSAYLNKPYKADDLQNCLKLFIS